MRSFRSVAGIATALFLTTSVLAHPTIEKRYDFDHNGIPDECENVGNGNDACLLDNGSWTTFATATATSTSSVVASASPPPAAVSAAAPAPDTSSGQGTASGMATGSLPSASDFGSQNGTSWTMEYVGNLNYSGILGTQGLQGDKARSSVVGGKTIWNFGDMECPPDYTVCGFSMGPAMYDTTGDFTMNTKDIANINDALFASNYSTDGAPQDSGCSAWGMDNSNIAPINDTAGVVYSWEMYRGCTDNPAGVNKGLAVSLVTIGDDFPVATRLGPLLTDGSAVQVGLLAVLAAENYIYSYTVSGSNVLVGRVSPANNAPFSADNYEFLSSDGQTWVPGIPSAADAGNFNMVTSQQGGWGCSVYGSAMYSNYFNQYMLFCDDYENFFNFYTSDTPYGPWSDQYQIIKGVQGYGSMVHPGYSPGGSNKVLYISQGPNTVFDVWKVTFGYGD